MEGVVRFPSELGITLGSPASMTAMHELLVPRSIPIILLTPSVLHILYPKLFITYVINN